MRNLVRRYVTLEQRKAENEGVTEDDVNEIKNDISAFRFELIEIMRQSGMNTTSATGPSGMYFVLSYIIECTLKKTFCHAAAGKKNRQKERRLMKGFNIGSSNSSNFGGGSGGGGGGGGGGGNANVASHGKELLGKKCSLTVNTADVTIDMHESVKRSPMHRLARLAKMAGSNTAKDSHNNSLDEDKELGHEATTSNGGGTTRKWGKLIQAASGGIMGYHKRSSVDRTPSNESSFKRAGSSKSDRIVKLVSPQSHSSGQDAMSATEIAMHGSSNNDDNSFETTCKVELSDEENLLVKKESKYSRSRGGVQCLNPGKLQPQQNSGAPPMSPVSAPSYEESIQEAKPSDSLIQFTADNKTTTDNDKKATNKLAFTPGSNGAGLNAKGSNSSLPTAPEKKLDSIHSSAVSSPMLPGVSSKNKSQTNSGWL